MRWAPILLTAFVACAAAVLDAQAPAVRTGAHAYYLFVSRADSCEACYVPLLVTATPLEELARRKSDESAVIITTYERDSLVGPPRTIVVKATAIQPNERRIALQDREYRQYRYQEIPAGEALSLLRHPEGRVPISRTLGMGVPSAAVLAEVIAKLQSVKE